MKIQWKNLITCLAIPLAVGSLSALLTRNSMETFNAITKPDLACSVMAADSQNNPSVLSNIKTCGISDDSIPAMGNFCRLLKL